MAQHPEGRIHHGKKRPAENDPDGSQPLVKKFGRLYLEPWGATIARTPESPGIQQNDESSAGMLLDDTKHTVYIHSLDQEIAEAEAPDDSVLFLPGFGERLAKIPKSVIGNTKSNCTELIPYGHPVSLTISRDADKVHRAMLETRERATARYYGGWDYGGRLSNDFAVSPAERTVLHLECLSQQEYSNQDEAMDID